MLNADGDLADEVNVLKDYHLHGDAQTESEIQRDISARLHRLDASNATLGNPTTYEEDARPYFMTILADETVTLEDNTRDRTPFHLDNSRPYKYTGVEKLASEESDMKLLPRVHQRIVFKELCDTL